MGKRDDNKAVLRARLADVAAALFAEHGYDSVTVMDIAREAGTSEQTVYNYFPAKQDLVLDRAEDIRIRYGAVVGGRTAGTSPAAALEPLLLADIAYLDDGDPVLARGQFVAQSVLSPVLRRFTLEFRERQVTTIAEAIRHTNPEIPAWVAHAHAAALVWVAQAVADAIGTHVIEATADSSVVAERIRRDVHAALDELDRSFRTITSPRTSS